jgi:uncharacterized protein (DUF2235 family)
LDCFDNQEENDMKKLALFFDGTWNKRPDKTNVFRLYEMTASQRSYRGVLGKRAVEDRPASAEPITQIKYYHQGVGVNWGEKMFGGAFGYGISRNIKDGYLWLSEQYEEGDDVYMFGFSRGAYTARSLVGLIRKCGIPRMPMEAFAKEAYHIYREKQWQPDGREAAAFKKTFSWNDVGIKFLGVWDTVGALGIPAHRIWFGKDYYTWHDTELSRMVENAYHALALDEHRPDFAATLWSSAKKPARSQTVEQRWFPGSHADVGGGYRDGRLQKIPLRWMQQKAEECGLQFIRTADVDPGDYLAPMHDSFGDFALGLYANLPWIYPYYRPFGLGVREVIDESVWKRVESSNGKNEKGKKYFPPGLVGLVPKSGKRK